MSSTRDMIKAVPLTDKPAGMSQATFAQHLFTSRWYELSDQGQVVGSPLDLDFYKHDVGQGTSTRSTVKTKELSKV